MNKYSDNLQVRNSETKDMKVEQLIDGEVEDFKQSQNCMFLLKLNSSTPDSTVTLRIIESKDERGTEEPRTLLESETFAIPGQMPRYYAFDVKAEDLSLDDGYAYARLQVETAGVLALPVLATILNISNARHRKSEGAGLLYDGVFDRLHLTAPEEAPPIV